MNTIYVVFGATGEYDDSRTWVVCWYGDKTSAEKHAELANKKAKEIFSNVKNNLYYFWTIPKNANEYDKKMDMDYTGTTYYVEEIEKGELK